MSIGKQKLHVAAAALMLGLLALASGSRAHADIHCATLQGLNDTMDYLAFTNEDKDRPSLQGKLDEAQKKLEDSNVCDAGQKIDDFNNKLDKLALATKTKVSETAPGALRCAREGSEALAADWLTGCEPVPERPRGKGPNK